MPDTKLSNVLPFAPVYRHPQTLEPFCGDDWPTIDLEARVMSEPVYHVPIIRVLSPLDTAPLYGLKQVIEDGLMLIVLLGMTLGIPLLWWYLTHR